MMSEHIRVNGFGAAWLDLERADEDNESRATLWITAFFLPIVPVRSAILRVRKIEFGALTYEDCGGCPLRPLAVILTYVRYWLLYPALLFGPWLVLEEYRVSHEIRIAEWRDAYMVAFPAYLLVFLGLLHLGQRLRLRLRR